MFLISVMTVIDNLFDGIKGSIKNQSASLVRPFGIDLLNKPQTDLFLHNKQIFFAKKSLVDLKPVPNLTDRSLLLFDQKYIEASPSYVWRYENDHEEATQLRCGNIMIENRILDTDFGNSAVLKDFLRISKRAVHSTDILIAPWSHYWTGYFDYITFIASKLCRIKNALSASDFADAVVAYPLFHTPFEQELLNLIGINPANIIDTRLTDVRFKTCVLGNNGSWFYPNSTDMLALKSLVESKVEVTSYERRRIYIRRSGRRRVLEEDKLIALLHRYDFDIIDDVPRTIAEQIALYRNASFVMGPHGASFTNILWCQPGTHLFELFPNDYMPEYFRYLTQVLDISYSAYCFGPPVASHHSHVQHDITVSVDEIERCLNVLLDQ